MSRILIVDDEANVLKVLRVLLSQQESFETTCVQSGEDALRELREQPFDLVISDLRLGSGMNGLDLLLAVKSKHEHLPVVMITAYGSVEVAVEAMKEGAYDFIRKPFKMDELLTTVKAALRHRRVNTEKSYSQSQDGGDVQLHYGSLVGESEAVQKVYDMIERVAATDATVLIQGESGTGKELVARAIHENSRRAEQRMVAVNCAALPAPLLESEIFGHAEGAFTGATGNRDGLFLAASGGTLFLDEIGAMAAELQGKFLRALQERKIRRVGENTDVPVDVRIVAATNEPLEEKMESGEFREDLYYRISVIPIHLPPLRRRTEDIPLLIRHFCNRQSRQLGIAVSCRPEVVETMTDYAWPGNVRQLENAIACAATLCSEGEIRLEDLPPNIRTGSPALAEETGAEAHADAGRSLREFLREKEQEYMRLILERADGNRARAAEILGISRATLYRKLPELSES